MPEFRGNDFEIQLPDDYSDESSYAFALPARVDFRPSVVVKTELLATGAGRREESGRSSAIFC